MLKSIPPKRLSECLRDAASSPMADPKVSYPDWYLTRWHFLPEGYVSRRSARLYQEYIPALYNQGRGRALTKEVTQLLQQGSPKSVLEIGCGPGTILTEVGRRLQEAELTGLDLSPFFLEMARDNPALSSLGATLVHGDATHLGWPADSFDCVFAVHVFGHMPSAPADAALSEAVRVLAPGGRLLVVDHAWHSWAAPLSTATLRTKSFNFGLVRLRLLEKM